MHPVKAMMVIQSQTECWRPCDIFSKPVAHLFVGYHSVRLHDLQQVVHCCLENFTLKKHFIKPPADQKHTQTHEKHREREVEKSTT